jgi:hypothetical protein
METTRTMETTTMMRDRRRNSVNIKWFIKNVKNRDTGWMHTMSRYCHDRRRVATTMSSAIPVNGINGVNNTRETTGRKRVNKNRDARMMRDRRRWCVIQVINWGGTKTVGKRTQKAFSVGCIKRRGWLRKQHACLKKCACFKSIEHNKSCLSTISKIFEKNVCVG